MGLGASKVSLSVAPLGGDCMEYTETMLHDEIPMRSDVLYTPDTPTVRANVQLWDEGQLPTTGTNRIHDALWFARGLGPNEPSGESKAETSDESEPSAESKEAESKEEQGEESKNETSDEIETSDESEPSDESEDASDESEPDPEPEHGWVATIRMAAESAAIKTARLYPATFETVRAALSAGRRVVVGFSDDDDSDTFPAVIYGYTDATDPDQAHMSMLQFKRDDTVQATVRAHEIPLMFSFRVVVPS
jgi:hypothetical protein